MALLVASQTQDHKRVCVCKTKQTPTLNVAQTRITPGTQVKSYPQAGHLLPGYPHTVRGAVGRGLRYLQIIVF